MKFWSFYCQHIHIKILKNENFEQSHSAEKLKRGDPSGFLNFSLLQNIKKTLLGDPLETKKFGKNAFVGLILSPRVFFEAL